MFIYIYMQQYFVYKLREQKLKQFWRMLFKLFIIIGIGINWLTICSGNIINSSKNIIKSLFAVSILLLRIMFKVHRYGKPLSWLSKISLSNGVDNIIIVPFNLYCYSPVHFLGKSRLMIPSRMLLLICRVYKSSKRLLTIHLFWLL